MSLETRTLGKSGIDVTTIGVGLWAAGNDEWGPTDDKAVLDAIDAALDAGITFYDTADVYGMGHSEELLAKAMRGRRDQFIVASKIGWVGFDEDEQITQYRTVNQLIAGVESNLKRLDTDYIDIMQSHINFRDPTMEVFIEGFQRLHEQGKIRAYGTSTSDFEYFKSFNADGGCATLQIDYSILHRMPESDLLPYCQENNIGVIVRGALAMGILTGKFDGQTTFHENDFRSAWITDPEQNTIFLDDLHKTRQLEPLSKGKTMAQLALQFVLSHPAVTTVIPGIKNERQLRDNIGAALMGPLEAAEMAAINKVVPPGGGRKIWPA